jgi:hypothetical protein
MAAFTPPPQTSKLAAPVKGLSQAEQTVAASGLPYVVVRQEFKSGIAHGGRLHIIHICFRENQPAQHMFGLNRSSKFTTYIFRQGLLRCHLPLLIHSFRAWGVEAANDAQLSGQGVQVETIGTISPSVFTSKQQVRSTHWDIKASQLMFLSTSIDSSTALCVTVLSARRS